MNLTFPCEFSDYRHFPNSPNFPHLLTFYTFVIKCKKIYKNLTEYELES